MVSSILGPDGQPVQSTKQPEPKPPKPDNGLRVNEWIRDNPGAVQRFS